MSPRKSPLGSRPSIFQRTDTGVPELAEHTDGQTANHIDVSPSEHSPVPVDPPLPKRIKRTFYLPPEDVYALEDLQTTEHRRTGAKPELSHLVSEAIQLLSAHRRQDSRTS